MGLEGTARLFRIRRRRDREHDSPREAIGPHRRPRLSHIRTGRYSERIIKERNEKLKNRVAISPDSSVYSGRRRRGGIPGPLVSVGDPLMTHSNLA